MAVIAAVKQNDFSLSAIVALQSQGTVSAVLESLPQVNISMSSHVLRTNMAYLKRLQYTPTLP